MQCTDNDLRSQFFIGPAIQTTIEIDALRNNSRCLFFHLSNGIMNDIRSYKKIAIRHDDDGDEHTF